MNTWQILSERFGQLPNDVVLRSGENGNRRVWSYFSDLHGPKVAAQFRVLAAEAGVLLGDASAAPELAWFSLLAEKRHAIAITAAVPITAENSESLGLFVTWEMIDAAGVSQQLAATLATTREAEAASVESAAADHAADVAKVLAGDNHAIIAGIAADGELSLEEKMRKISVVDSTTTAWLSPRWAELLDVSDSRIRQTDNWKRRQAVKNKADD